MIDGIERRERNKAKASRLRVILDRVLVEAGGWNPVSLKGHSKRFRCTIPGQGMRIVAIKIVGRGYPGWIGFQQKKDGTWHTPLTDSDHLLYATPYQQKLGVWMFPISRVVERLEAVQQLYDERGGRPSAALWFNIFEQAPQGGNVPPCQLNFAEGKPPMWLLPFTAATAEEESADEPVEANSKPAEPPSPASVLSRFTDGQLIDELRLRGLKSFTFRDDDAGRGT